MIKPKAKARDQWHYWPQSVSCGVRGILPILYFITMSQSGGLVLWGNPLVAVSSTDFVISDEMTNLMGATVLVPACIWSAVRI